MKHVAPSASITMPGPGRHTMLIDQACEHLCVSKRTIYYWIRAGRLQTIRTLGGSQRVLVSSLDGWAETRPAQAALLEPAAREEAMHQ